MGIKLNYTPLYSPQTNGLVERQNSTIKTSLKAALLQMGEDHKENWYDMLPWILLMKRTSYQKDLGASPSMLCYGSNPAVPGDLLRDPGAPMTSSEMEELKNFVENLNNKTPIQTSTPTQVPVEEPPASVKYVYTKQHNTTGLQAPYVGPFPVVSRPSRSTAKIRVGYFKNGVPKYEVRSWRDLKIAHLAPDAEEASRPSRGRPPSKPAQVQLSSEPASKIQDGAQINKLPDEDAVMPTATKTNSNVGGKRPARSTRNPNPAYVDSVSCTPEAWSATSEQLAELNYHISAPGYRRSNGS